MLMMVCKHLQTISCKLLEVAFDTLHHDSDPYKRATFTLVLYILSQFRRSGYRFRFPHRTQNYESSSCFPGPQLDVPIRPAILTDVAAKVGKVFHFIDFFPIRQPVCICGVYPYPLRLRFANPEASPSMMGGGGGKQDPTVLQVILKNNRGLPQRRKLIPLTLCQ